MKEGLTFCGGKNNGRVKSHYSIRKCSFGTGSFLLMNIGDKPKLSNNGLLTTVGWNFNGQTAYAFDGGIFVTGSWVYRSVISKPVCFSGDPCAIEITPPFATVFEAFSGVSCNTRYPHSGPLYLRPPYAAKPGLNLSCHKKRLCQIDLCPSKN